jgi:hypothetical protein
MADVDAHEALRRRQVADLEALLPEFLHKYRRSSPRAGQ